MKLSLATLSLLLAAVQGFTAPRVVEHKPALGKTTLCNTYNKNGLDLTGNTWKPDSEKMGSTDTGDFFPEGYDHNEIDYTQGMMGSQTLLDGGDRGFELPGLENVGEDAVITGGIETASDIPAGMEFIPSSVPDKTMEYNVPANGNGVENEIEVAPVCMTFEDYFAAFSKDSHPAFSVVGGTATGRMDRRGGEPSIIRVMCNPAGQSGTLEGNLVINLPEDNSKICYKFTVNAF